MDTVISVNGLKLQRHRQGGSDGERVNRDCSLSRASKTAGAAFQRPSLQRAKPPRGLIRLFVFSVSAII
jgi:hypothetical protein